MIELIDVSKKYQQKDHIFNALDGIGVKIGKGDYLAVTGASGAGKSTLLHVIGGLVHPDSGSLLYNGKNLYGQSSNELGLYRKYKIGFVFQQFHLMPYLTVKENISLACHEESHRDNLQSYLEKCLLSPLKDKYPSELSVGEKQRVAFVRAIIANPEILLADEPTGNLDPANSKVLMELIGGYHKNGGTVVLVSHHPDIATYADRSIQLEKGKLLPAFDGRD